MEFLEVVVQEFQGNVFVHQSIVVGTSLVELVVM